MHAQDIQGNAENQRRNQHNPEAGDPLEQVALPRPRTVLDRSDNAAANKIAAQDKEDDDGLFSDRSAVASGNVIGGLSSRPAHCRKRRKEQAPRMT